jgi:hypothetical protein
MLLASYTHSIADIAAHPKCQAGNDCQYLPFDVVGAILVMERARMVETVGVPSMLEGALLDEARRLWKLFETAHGSSEVVYRILQAQHVELFAYYLPGQWHPYITVATDDLSDADLCRARQDLRAYYPR